jgi:hypothetical protein
MLFINTELTQQQDRLATLSLEKLRGLFKQQITSKKYKNSKMYLTPA